MEKPLHTVYLDPTNPMGDCDAHREKTHCSRKRTKESGHLTEHNPSGRTINCYHFNLDPRKTVVEAGNIVTSGSDVYNFDAPKTMDETENVTLDPWGTGPVLSENSISTKFQNPNSSIPSSPPGYILRTHRYKTVPP